MGEVTIRPAIAEDIAAITAIYATAVVDGLASWEYEPPGEAEMRRRFDTVLAGGFPYFVADRSGKVIGYTYASPYRTRPGYRWTIENTVYVAPQAYRTGAGRRLMTELISACTVCGYRQMIAVIGDSANQASIGLHRAMGFAVCGTIQSIGWKADRWLDSVLMQRALGAGDTRPAGEPPSHHASPPR